MNLVRLFDIRPQAWLNGRGVTRELLAWPSPTDWQVRISVADIDVDGAFSTYPGVERWFTVLQGAGVVLAVDGKQARLVRGDAPVRFAGQAAVEARLIDGPTRDLNLMLRESPGTMQSAADGQTWIPSSTQCGLFSAVPGLCKVEGHDAVAVPAYALLWFAAAPSTLRFTAGQRPAALIGWWLAASPRGS